MGVYIELPKEWAKWSFDVRDIHDNILEAKVTDLDLVRCGECKHYGFKETDRGGFPCCTNVIGATPYRMPTDFCSYGERRADDNTIKADK